MTHEELDDPTATEIQELIDSIADEVSSGDLGDIERTTQKHVSKSDILDRPQDSLVETHTTLCEYKYLKYPDIDEDQQELLIRRQVKEVLVDYVKRQAQKEYRRRQFH